MGTPSPIFYPLALGAGATPPTPPAGVIYVFVASDGTAKQVNDQGVVSAFGGGGGGGLGSLTAPVVKATVGVASASTEGVDFNIPQTDQAISLYRAQLLLGSTLKRVIGTNFQNDNEYGTMLISISATATMLVTDGGGIRLDTTATNGRGICVYLHGIPTNIVNPRTSRWYARSRMAVSTAIDAQAICFAGWMKQASAAANPQLRMGVNGAVSTGFYSAAFYDNSNALIGQAISTVAIDTGYHTFEGYNDGTNFSFVVDGGTPVTTASTNIDASQAVSVCCEAYNGSTAALRRLDIASMWMVTPGN